MDEILDNIGDFELKSIDFEPEEVEAELCRLNDVRAARVIMDAGGVEEVHILASADRNPKQLARDIESLLMAKYGIPVDHRKISVAMVSREESEVPTPEVVTSKKGLRPKIITINAESSGINAKVTVRLEMEGEEYLGEAKGPASQTGRLRLVALATLDAIGKYIQTSCGFALEDVSVVALGKEKVAVACITLVTPLGEQSFSGSAIVKQNDKDSVVRAVLDAINRRFSHLTIA